jgi:hypothetical protein
VPVFGHIQYFAFTFVGKFIFIPFLYQY